MKLVIKCFNHACIYGWVLVTGLLLGNIAYAQTQKLSDKVNTYRAEFQGAYLLLVLVFGIVGVAFVGIGVVQMVKKSRGNQQIEAAGIAGLILGGGLLLLLGGFIGVVTGTLDMGQSGTRQQITY